MQPRISQYRLLVSDFPACFRFYRDIMNLPVSSGSEDDVYAGFDLAPQQSLGLFNRAAMAEAVGTHWKPAHANAQDTVVLVFQVDNLDEAVMELREKGVSFAAAPTDRPEWGMRTAHFRDPDGNLLEIFHPLRMG